MTKINKRRMFTVQIFQENTCFPGRNKTKKNNLEAAIKETAWQQLAEHRVSALSLCSIARELGITAPAIYNYFPHRDDLVTALIVDAFTSFADSQAEQSPRSLKWITRIASEP